MNTTLNAAIRCLEEARDALCATYVTAAAPGDPGWELAVANTPRPVELAEPLDKLTAALSHLLNLEDA